MLIPTLIDRHVEKRIAPGRKDGPELSNREYIYRQGFDLGRHVIGFELSKIMAGVDWFRGIDDKTRVAVVGWGEGGLLALYAGALDERIGLICASGSFGRREQSWREPIERNIWCSVSEFGDAEVAAMAASHAQVIIGQSTGPAVKVQSKAAAPGALGQAIDPEAEFARAQTLAGREKLSIIGNPDDEGLTTQMLGKLFEIAGDGITTGLEARDLKHLRNNFDPAPRQARQLAELERHCQELIQTSQQTRRDFLKNLDTSSLEKYEASAKPYRETFHKDVMGRFDDPLLPMNPRSRKLYDTPKYTGYEVVLDVFEDVFAYGILLIPKDIKDGEKRPVVVCQHGLEGRPTDTTEGDSKYYHDFAAKLAERGFITFAPQNIYILKDRFRVFHRKGNPIGKTIWSVMIPQHQQILNFLKTLPNVDPKRLAFYGLSYGGKTAMRIPAVLTDYCLSICSGDFNEWVAKNASTSWPFSYVFTSEYEIFEWDLGSTFNYAEMAALIAPRPFMVERGHYDGVSVDELVSYEYAKVRFLYGAKLKIPERAEIEYFDGPHMINGKGTFDFLHKHLQWEKR